MKIKKLFDNIYGMKELINQKFGKFICAKL